MSNRATDIVWRAHIVPAANKLVLLALADSLNARTGQLNPSMAAIASKTGISRSQTQRIVRAHIANGLLSVKANALGGAPGTTPEYRMHLDRIAQLVQTDRTDATPTDGADATPLDETAEGRTDGAGATPTGSTDATGSADARGSTHAAEGSHGGRGGVAPVLPKPEGTGMKQRNAAADASGAALPSPISMSAKERVWAFGPALIGGAENAAKSFLGKLVKGHGEEVVAAALDACAQELPGEPKAWITAACMRRSAAEQHAIGSDRSDARPSWALRAGFANRFDAENAGCFERNSSSFRDGHSTKVPA